MQVLVAATVMVQLGGRDITCAFVFEAVAPLSCKPTLVLHELVHCCGSCLPTLIHHRERVQVLTVTALASSRAGEVCGEEDEDGAQVDDEMQVSEQGFNDSV